MNASEMQTSASWSTWHVASIRAADAAAITDPQMEHRWGNRKPCRALVRVSAGAGVSGFARLRDVSVSGAFLETALPLPQFAQIAIAVLSDESSTRAIEFIASVVRTEPGGVGIEWCEPVSGSICRTLGCTIKCAAHPQ